MSDDVRAFLDRNGYDSVEIPLELGTIKDQDDINPLVARHGIFTKKEASFISVANIEGYDYLWKKQTSDLILSLSDYFDSKGDSYHSRSTGLLKCDSDELIQIVFQSSRIEPICVREIERGKYIISSNGIHRFSALRVHYLLECARVGFNPEIVSEIAKKYTIPVKEEKLDIEKTYSKYILESIGAVSRIDAEYDINSHNYTGKSEVYFNDGSKSTLDDQGLISMVNAQLSFLSQNDPAICDYFSEQCTRYESFSEYASKYVPLISKGKGDDSDAIGTNKSK